MQPIKAFALGVLVATIASCTATAAFRYYGIKDADFDQGTLIGAEPKDDVPFRKCKPNFNNENPCVVLFSEEFFAMKQDYLDCKMRLKECEKN